MNVTRGVLYYFVNWDNQRSRPIRSDFSTPRILANVSVELTSKTGPQPSNAIGINLSRLAVFLPFRSPVTFLRVKGFMSICHTDYLEIVGNWRVSEG